MLTSVVNHKRRHFYAASSCYRSRTSIQIENEIILDLSAFGDLYVSVETSYSVCSVLAVVQSCMH